MRSEMIVAPAFFLMVAFCVWTLVNAWQRHMRLKLMREVNSKLLDRIGSVKDFNEFLQTEGGTRFMDSLTVERLTTRPQDSILRAIQIGIVLLVLGLGFLGLGSYFSARYGASGDDFEVLTVVGVIAGSLGLGFLISAAASFRLAKSLGVLEPPQRLGGPHASPTAASM
jgi:hypothetical protein